MVPNPRASVRSHQLRSLNLPEPVRVEKRGGRRWLVRQNQRLAIVQICDEWRIVDEWWRQPLSRRYFQLLLEDGRLITLFQDRLTNQWYLQSY